LAGRKERRLDLRVQANNTGHDDPSRKTPIVRLVMALASGRCLFFFFRAALDFDRVFCDECGFGRCAGNYRGSIGQVDTTVVRRWFFAVV
jgi:hypothetical protein